MIYLLYGNDMSASRTKLHALLDALSKKRPDAELFHITNESRDPFSLEELTHSQGLFEQKYIVVFDQIFENKDKKEELLNGLKEMQSAEHMFVFLEGKLDKKALTKFEKYAKRVEEFVRKEKEGRDFGVMGRGKLNLGEFNIFDLPNALGRRDKKNLWVLYQKAKMRNIPDEEIHGLLFWQVKSMLLASGSKSAKESGLNPFVFQKASGFLRNYSEAELRKLSQSLIALSHDARRGIHEFDVALERFILSI